VDFFFEKPGGLSPSAFNNWKTSDRSDTGQAVQWIGRGDSEILQLEAVRREPPGGFGEENFGFELPMLAVRREPSGGFAEVFEKPGGLRPSATILLS
jgi:hypothetical protein